MGYTIMIGEAVLEVDEDELQAWFKVEPATHLEAPVYARGMYGENRIDASYGGLGIVMHELGLRELFMGDLMRTHPGISRLRSEHVIEIQEAVESYRARAGDAAWKRESMESDILSRGTWLAWWTEWAVKNCKNPAVCNR